MDVKIFKISSRVVVEKFNDGALALLLDNRSLVELNKSASDILAQTDGQHSLADIAFILVGEYSITFEEALLDVTDLYNQLTVQGIVEPIISH